MRIRFVINYNLLFNPSTVLWVLLHWNQKKKNVCTVGLDSEQTIILVSVWRANNISVAFFLFARSKRGKGKSIRIWSVQRAPRKRKTKNNLKSLFFIQYINHHSGGERRKNCKMIVNIILDHSLVTLVTIYASILFVRYTGYFEMTMTFVG